ncbi:helix-turn-helix domain-containing protein [Nocardia seriolae]|uniref:helix-turn-helix domain-containing protein n=2 Tax=Nocardia seriolae TaxID=37332 RepID=UPI00051A232E|nr:helix-turn-helix transcriptional regulator [Nocardia seriolae]MTJ65808.1 helix-turn-helix domain-containing protein [Nocardia seriolae]MTJ73933.1 helix-turn-helix domain-containing protein [Nocardia seriolae]MTJ86259.1 helix-turn-helix domain-containing protein [Nocardia seriolae]MTK30254.1 helix-turn-helix domain-containing protein [Nocardia seriolae]MTK43806.1 helix-turn-helix domain-containing protein [Nocardia seriolae]
MAGKTGPTLRSQWLGQQLRRYRDEAGMTLKEAAAYLKRDSSTVSRFEAGLYPPREDDVRELLTLYGVADGRVREALQKLSLEVWRKGWWEGYAQDIDPSIVDYAWLEARAAEIKSFNVVVVPGLLQTPAYAEAVIRAVDPDSDDAQVDRWLEVRMIRQQVLTRPRPVRLTVILDQSILRRQIGGAEVHAEQLAHLANMADRSNVTVRLLPEAIGAHAAPDGSFKIFDLPDPYPTLACVETPAGVIYVEADGIQRFTAAFDRLREVALSPDDSAAVLREQRR